MSKLEAELIVVLLAAGLGWLVGGWIGLAVVAAVVAYVAALTW